jgi:hypothetical protein
MNQETNRINPHSITLLDQIACAALSSSALGTCGAAKDVAARAYDIAEAMIVERGKRNTTNGYNINGGKSNE